MYWSLCGRIKCSTPGTDYGIWHLVIPGKTSILKPEAEEVRRMDPCQSVDDLRFPLVALLQVAQYAYCIVRFYAEALQHWYAASGVLSIVESYCQQIIASVNLKAFNIYVIARPLINLEMPVQLAMQNLLDLYFLTWTLYVNHTKEIA